MVTYEKGRRAGRVLIYYFLDMEIASVAKR